MFVLSAASLPADNPAAGASQGPQGATSGASGPSLDGSSTGCLGDSQCSQDDTDTSLFPSPVNGLDESPPLMWHVQNWEC
eukprot:11004511-Alexandrium_andersonii.AAC.1